VSGAKPRLGFLGVGWIGLHRMKAILDSGAATAAVIADADPQALARAAACAPEAALARTLPDILAHGVDGVVIATPSAMHSEQAVEALRAGAAVFCQKPLGRTALEAQRAVNAARAADRLLCVDFSYRFARAFCALRDLVANGDLGRVYACDLTFHNGYGPDKPWFYDAALSGGGCVMDLGVHLVDLALWMLGEPAPETISSALFQKGERLGANPTVVEDYAAAHFFTREGAHVRIACSWGVHGGADAIIEARAFGAAGGARVRNVNGSFYDFVAERHRGATSETVCEPPDAWGGRAAIDWARRLAAGERFDPAAREIVIGAQALDRIYGR